MVSSVVGIEEDLASEAIQLADGLLLTGGTDIDPASYGRPIDKEQTHDPDSSRDRLEMALIQEARKRELPILGICRGFQMLNVAYGGTLDQHRPHQNTAIVENPTLRIELTKVSLTPGSLSARAVGSEHVEVYCLHHQGIDDIGAGLRTTGIADDGMVEAVEDPSANFVLGVLWHPEQMLEHQHSRAIYQAFLSEVGVRQ